MTRTRLVEGPFPVAAAAEHALDRRRFLCAAGAAMVAVAAGEWAAHRGAPPVRRLVRLRDSGSLAVGTVREVPADDGAAVLVVRIDAETVVGFDRRCPHLGCPVRWAAGVGRFECPCHHAAFDARTGAVLTGPPQRGLDPVEVMLG